MAANDSIDERAAGTNTDLVPLWHNRDYMLRWSGQAVSILGTQVSAIATPLLVLALTNSPAQAGFIASVRTIPYLVFGLLAGALVDRWDRKRTMILCDAGRAIALGSIPIALWTGHLSIVQLYVMSLIEGTLSIFFGLANTASLPRIVAREQLPAAMGQSEATYQIGGVLGPTLGGVLYGVGRLVPFVADAFSYAVSVISLSFMRAEFQEERTAPSRPLWREIGEGLSWLWNQRLVRTMGFLSAMAWITLMSQQLVIIVVARQHHVSSASIGLIFAVGGVGGIAGSLVAGRLGRHLRFGVIIAGCAWIWALAWPLYAVTSSPILLGLITGSIMLVFPIYNVTQMSYRVAIIPDVLQGRVNSTFRLISFTGQPIGAALSGLLLQATGARNTVLLLAFAPFAMAIWATRSKHIQKAIPLSEVRTA